MAARGWGLFSLYIYIENLKNLLVRNHQTDFHIILQKCSFGDSLPRLFKPFGYVKKHGRQGAGLIFPIYLYRKLKKSSCQKPLDWFPYTFAEIFLWWSSTKVVQAIWIHQKKAARGRGLFSLYICIENLKNLLVRNHQTDFNIILQKCSFGDPLPRLFKPFGFVKKTWPPGGGAYFPYILAGLGGSFGSAVQLETRRSWVQPPPRSATFFRGDWSWNMFYGHSLPSTDSRRAVFSFWRKNVHNTG